MIIRDICEWNEVRDCVEFDGGLEFTMLAEELDEFAWSTAKTLKDKFGELSEGEYNEKEEEIVDYFQSDEGQLMIKVNRADALADIIFVAVGSLYKLVGDVNKTEDILNAVIAANNTKSTKKNEQGKITKPKDFVGPEDIIKNIIKG
jgi:predicted HAD superfamily Cof-like phosphohydrolase